MKYIRRTSKNITSNFLKELLEDRNVLDCSNKEMVKSFLYPDRTNLESPPKLDNMERSFNLFKYHLENRSRIYFIVD